jgi:hypothetical protein
MPIIFRTGNAWKIGFALVRVDGLPRTDRRCPFNKILSTFPCNTPSTTQHIYYLDTRLQFSVFLHLPSKFLLARQLVHVTLANELFRNANCIKDSIYLVTVKTVIRFNLFLLERVLLICSLFLSTFNSTGAFTCMQDSDCKIVARLWIKVYIWMYVCFTFVEQSVLLCLTANVKKLWRIEKCRSKLFTIFFIPLTTDLIRVLFLIW